MPVTMTQNQPFVGTIKVANATSVVVNGLPAGVTAGALSGDTVTVSGTPTVTGSFTVTVNAANVCGGGSTTSNANGLAAGSGTVAAAPVLPVWGGQNCCGTPETAEAYVTGTTVGFPGGAGFTASASGAEVTKYVKSVFGFSELDNSCNRRAILFLTAADEVTGYSVYELAGNTADCL